MHVVGYKNYSMDEGPIMLHFSKTRNPVIKRLY